MLELGGSGAPGGAPAAAEVVKDGSDQGFMADVIDASREVPVLVQFTAPWCGPCRTLGPQLEEAVKAKGGKVRLVRIDIDQHPQVAGQLGVQSIPAVFGFAEGRPVDAFQGAQPASQINAFIDALLRMSGGGAQGQQIEAVLDASDAALAQGDAGAAMQGYAQVMQADPDQMRALAGLARCYLAAGDADKAKEILVQAPADKAEDPALVQVRSSIELAEAAGGGGGDVAALSARVEADPGDMAARHDLAQALAARGDAEAAIDHLLEVIRRDREWEEGKARDLLLKVLDALGPAHPAAKSGRRRFASLMFA